MTFLVNEIWSIPHAERQLHATYETSGLTDRITMGLINVLLPKGADVEESEVVGVVRPASDVFILDLLTERVRVPADDVVILLDAARLSVADSECAFEVSMACSSRLERRWSGLVQQGQVDLWCQIREMRTDAKIREMRTDARAREVSTRATDFEERQACWSSLPARPLNPISDVYRSESGPSSRSGSTVVDVSGVAS